MFVDGLIGANRTDVQFGLSGSSGVEAQKRSHKVVKRRCESMEFGRPSHVIRLSEKLLEGDHFVVSVIGDIVDDSFSCYYRSGIFCNPFGRNPVGGFSFHRFFDFRHGEILFSSKLNCVI